MNRKIIYAMFNYFAGSKKYGIEYATYVLDDVLEDAVLNGMHTDEAKEIWDDLTSRTQEDYK